MPLLLCSLLLEDGLVCCIATGKVWLHSGHSLCSGKAHMCGFMDRKPELSQLSRRIPEESLRRRRTCCISFVGSNSVKWLCFRIAETVGRGGGAAKRWGGGRSSADSLQSVLCVWINTESRLLNFACFSFLLECLQYSKSFFNLVCYLCMCTSIFPQRHEAFSFDHFLGSGSTCYELRQQEQPLLHMNYTSNVTSMSQ